jgi:hypothetical protein
MDLCVKDFGKTEKSFLRPDSVADELHRLCSELVVFRHLLPELLLMFFDAPVQ